MKKLSKILVLLLSLIAIVTAFTVVALAEDAETGEQEVSGDYDGMFTDQAGNVTYFKGHKEFEEIVQSVIDNADWANREKMNTIVLYNDIECYKSFSFSVANYGKLTIDLNGHTLTVVAHTGNVYKDDGTGNYVARMRELTAQERFT